MIEENCSYFNDPFKLKYLFTSIINPQLEYASIIWETLLLVIMLNMKKFIIIFFSLFFLNVIYIDPHHNYVDILNYLNLKPLTDRRNLKILLFKLFNNNIEDFSLLTNISFKINNHSIVIKWKI